jgi:hypothetical protein
VRGDWKSEAMEYRDVDRAIQAKIEAGFVIQPRKLAGRCTDGFERGHGSLYHAVSNETGRALCGAKPGRHSAGWQSEPGEAVTCPRCLKKQAA